MSGLLYLIVIIQYKWYNLPICNLHLRSRYMLIFKIIFCILLVCPMAYITFLLFNRMIDMVIKRK